MEALWSQALIESLQTAPLLVGDLPEAGRFDRRKLGSADAVIRLDARQKLGHLYESALEHLLMRSSSVELLATSLQIVD
ncbi:MAG TPA: hypothetical protein VJ952_13555, partial [Opitutales bacterium]|nr:hypothetical protein [Opitutales bacterium]